MAWYIMHCLSLCQQCSHLRILCYLFN